MLQKLSDNNLPIGIGPSEHPGEPGDAWGSPVVAVVAVAYLAWLLLTPSKAARRAETT